MKEISILPNFTKWLIHVIIKKSYYFINRDKRCNSSNSKAQRLNSNLIKFYNHVNLENKFKYNCLA